jgi:hypothetical protein
MQRRARRRPAARPVRRTATAAAAGGSRSPLPSPSPGQGPPALRRGSAELLAGLPTCLPVQARARPPSPALPHAAPGAPRPPPPWEGASHTSPAACMAQQARARMPAVFRPPAMRTAATHEPHPGMGRMRSCIGAACVCTYLAAACPARGPPAVAWPLRGRRPRCAWGPARPMPTLPALCAAACRPPGACAHPVCGRARARLSACVNTHRPGRPCPHSAAPRNTAFAAAASPRPLPGLSPRPPFPHLLNFYLPSRRRASCGPAGSGTAFGPSLYLPFCTFMFCLHICIAYAMPTHAPRAPPC